MQNYNIFPSTATLRFNKKINNELFKCFCIYKKRVVAQICLTVPLLFPFFPLINTVPPPTINHKSFYYLSICLIRLLEKLKLIENESVVLVLKNFCHLLSNQDWSRLGSSLLDLCYSRHNLVLELFFFYRIIYFKIFRR